MTEAPKMSALEARNEWRRLKRDLTAVQKLIRSVNKGERFMIFPDGLRILTEQESKLQKQLAEIEGLFK